MLRSLVAVVFFLVASIVGRAVEDPSLQLYLDFESFRRDEAEGWILKDQSPNGFDVGISNFANSLALAPGKFGQAIQVATLHLGTVHTNGVPIYKAGDGITVSVWVSLPTPGYVLPVVVGKDILNNPIVSSFIGRANSTDGKVSLIGVGWRAYQKDGVTRAFRVSVTFEFEMANEWIHYAAVYDPRTSLALIYLDGNEIARGDAVDRPIADWGIKPQVSKVGMKFRKEPEGDDPVLVDELRFYSRAFSAREVRMLMQNPFDVSPRAKLATSWGALKAR